MNGFGGKMFKNSIFNEKFASCASAWLKCSIDLELELEPDLDKNAQIHFFDDDWKNVQI